MSRGGVYRSPDGSGVVHLRFGPRVQAPAPCSAPRLPGDDPMIFGDTCGRIGGKLCDAVVGEYGNGSKRTCDAALCAAHVTHVEPDTDYCPRHAGLAAEDA